MQNTLFSYKNELSGLYVTIWPDKSAFENYKWESEWLLEKKRQQALYNQDIIMLKSIQ